MLKNASGSISVSIEEAQNNNLCSRAVRVRDDCGCCVDARTLEVPNRLFD
jgi:hypothetical protein